MIGAFISCPLDRVRFRPLTKQGFFKKYEYVYDEYFDQYICPNNKLLDYSTTNRDGYREYKSNPEDCKNCPYREQCTQSKGFQKIVTRHVWENYMELAEDVRHSPDGKEIYKLRCETIERVFADAKENTPCDIHNSEDWQGLKCRSC